MRRITAGLAVGVAALGLAAGTARADRRSYVWTYEYQTMPKGATEIEWYQTAVTGKTSDPQKTTKHETSLELEHGITDRWDGSIYQTFKWDGNGPLEYKGYKLRTRYRFGERSWPVPPLLYLEYQQDGKLAAPKFEWKFITSKDFGRINVAANYVGEVERKGMANETSHKAETGVSYQVAGNWRVGGEATLAKDKSYFGPTVSFGAGHNWFGLNVSWGSGSKADDVRLRYIVGLGF